MNSPSTPLSLVVMAAGGGTRYGGLKQLAPVGPHGESIMEYSILDALKGGVDRVVLVVRPEHRAAFDEKFVESLTRQCDVRYAFQTLDRYVPADYGPVERSKPWGTGHALLCSREEVDGPFAIINADDFYGPTAIATMLEFLRSLPSDGPLRGAMVGYPLRNTLSDFGAVSRGVCQLTSDGKLGRVVERHRITRAGEGGLFVDEQGLQQDASGNETVSMNLWGFPREVLDKYGARFGEFLAARPAPEKEFEIPGNVQQWIDAGELEIDVLPTSEQWCGLTYQDDLPVVLARVNALVAAGRYPEKLW